MTPAQVHSWPLESESLEEKHSHCCSLKAPQVILKIYWYVISDCLPGRISGAVIFFSSLIFFFPSINMYQFDDKKKKTVWSKGQWRQFFNVSQLQWHPTPVLLPGNSHRWSSLVGCSPRGREESDMTERLPFHFSLSCIGEGNGNPLQCSCLENPRDGGAW